MKIVERFEDMSPTGRLKLIRQDDGDIIIAIIPDPDNAQRSYVDKQVEFCTHGGGGQSPKTLSALYALMDAIEQDNTEEKQYRKS